jgi:hypothetical protein
VSGSGNNNRQVAVKTRRRIFQETQIRLKVLYSVREGDSTLKRCVTATKGDELVAIAKDGEWWQCTQPGDDEAAARAAGVGGPGATFIPDSYVQVQLVTVDREVVEAVGQDAAADRVLTVDVLQEQKDFEARLKRQEEDLRKKAEQLGRIQQLAKEQEERAEKAERERQRVASEKEALSASLRMQQEEHEREARALEQQQVGGWVGGWGGGGSGSGSAVVVVVVGGGGGASVGVVIGGGGSRGWCAKWHVVACGFS